MKRKSFLCLLLALIMVIGFIPTKSQASSTSYLVRIPGQFDGADRAKLLDEINRIRKEACDERIYHKDLGRNLGPDDYSPVKWSSDLEATAMMRAAEASLVSLHMRPNGDNIYSIYPDFTSGAENLAFMSLLKDSSERALRLWYEEKRNIGANLDPDKYPTGHYMNIINPDFNRVAMATFINPKSTFKCNSQMSLTKSTSDSGVNVSGPLPSEYTRELSLVVEVEPGASAGLSSFKIETVKDPAKRIKAFLTATLNSPNYAGPVTLDNVEWKISNSGIVESKTTQSSLELETKKIGKVTLEAYIRGQKMASKTVTLDEISSSNFKRLAGKNRIETAIEVSKNFYKAGDCQTAVIARADEFADALSAVPLAAQAKAPILLSDSKTLSHGIKAELKRLGVENVIMVGGENALSKGVEKSLNDMGSIDVIRIAGDNRCQTSINIAKMFKSKGGNTQKAYFASSRSFPDALSVGPLASINNHPVILVDPTSVSQEILKSVNDLGVKSSYIVGGPNAVSNSVAKKLPKTLERIYGQNRFETSAAIAKKFSEPGSAFLATGEKFADALACGPIAAKSMSPILLTGKKAIDPSLRAYIKNSEFEDFYVVGGPMVISDKVLKGLR